MTPPFITGSEEPDDPNMDDTNDRTLLICGFFVIRGPIPIIWQVGAIFSGGGGLLGGIPERALEPNQTLLLGTGSFPRKFVLTKILSHDSVVVLFG